MKCSYSLINILLHASLMLSASSLASSDTSTEQPLTAIDGNALWKKFKNNISSTWSSSTSELYVPLNTWHNRWAYDDDKISTYHETPWGIGYGKYRYDKDNNWHSLYAMAFMDSHNKVQPIIGYGYQKMWIPGKLNEWRFGIGFTASITARHEYNYIPLPLPLPLFSIEYNRLSLQTTYIPGTYNNGNVLFTWIRWQL